MSLRNSAMMRELQDDEKVGLAQELFATLETENSYRSAGVRAYDFLNGTQWTSQEIKILENRGQPAMTFNLIKPVINNIESLQKGNRSDISYKPEDGSGHDFLSAKVITRVSKHDLKKVGFDKKESASFRDYLVTGRGATQAFFNEQKKMIGFEHIDFRNLYIDNASVLDDLSDCTHLHIADYTSEAEVQMILKQNIRGGEEYQAGEAESMFKGDGADRVRIVYSWVKVPVTEADGKAWHYEYDCLLWRDGQYLAYFENPYPEVVNYPIQIKTLYRDLDNNPFGMVVGMIDAQRSYNHSRSKISHILNTRKYVYREGSFDGSDTDLADKLSKVDAVIGLENGAQDIEDITQMYDIQHLWQMAQESKDVIREISGLSEELQGSGSGQLSGKAIHLRQQSGIMRLTEVFDGLAQWKTEVGKAVMGIIKGNYDSARVERLIITGGEKDFEDKEQKEQARKLWSMINVKGLEDYDIVHSTDAISISQQEEEYNNIVQLYSMSPEQMPLIAVVQASNFINKDKIVETMNQHSQLIQQAQQGAQQVEQLQGQLDAQGKQFEENMKELQSRAERAEGSLMKIMQKMGAGNL